MYSTSYSFPILMKLEYSGEIFEKFSNINFHKNSSIGNQVVSCGRTDGQTDMKLIAAFRNFVKAPKTSSPQTVTVLVKEIRSFEQRNC